MKKTSFNPTLFILVTALCFLVTVATAESFRLGAPFTDHAVLQREMPVSVWGKASPDSRITVVFAGQKQTTLVDPKGNWSVKLAPMQAISEPQTMEIFNDGQSVATLQDLVVGEVWICSGQSNMQMRVKYAPDVEALQPKVQNVRSFTVERMVAFTEQEQCGGEWLKAAPDSAVALAFAHFLEESADVPVGIILTAWGSSSIEAWMPRDMTATVPHFQTIMTEFDADESTLSRIQAILDGPRPWPKPDDIFLRRQPNILYNAMMAPLAPYACRGLVWYQGERNTQSMEGMVNEPWYSRNSGMLRYGETLKHWIRRYREAWNNPDMHFLVVMLPGYFKPLDSGPQLGPQHPATHSWAWMRESQLKALELPGTSVANTIDLGDEKNIHPKDKLPVGQRLALLARRDTLDEPITADGPKMKEVEVEKGQIVIHFDSAKGLTTTDGQAPRGFWLADEAQEWVRAEARIEDNKVVLQAPELQAPSFVRYAFVGKPDVNLVNEAGLPAYPFRTDSFPPAL